MPVPAENIFFVDPRRCIGCQACVQACSECDTHKGQSMIQLDYIDRATSTKLSLSFACTATRPPALKFVLPMRSK